MSDNFLARLREGRLTCSEKYRESKDSIASKQQRDEGNVSEEWKTWQLVPVGGAWSAQRELVTSATDNNSGQRVLQAIKALDKQSR